MTATFHYPRCRRGVAALAAAALAVPAAGQIAFAPRAIPPAGAEAALQTPALADPYMRVVEDPGRTIALQIASRAFAPTRQGLPRVTLVGVAHVGERGFYRAVQALLEEHAVVLYESVKPPGASPPGGATEAQRIESTEAALEFLAALIEAHRAEHGDYPADLAALVQFAAGHDPRLGHFVAGALRDGWGRALVYRHGDGNDSFTLESLGADGQPGGEGPGTDLAAGPDAGGGALALAGEDSLQSELAAALGLEFQLDALDYSGAGFRPADLAMDELERALAAEGIDFAAIEGSLAGSSLPGKLAMFILRVVKFADRWLGGALADTFKVVLIEVLADEAVLEQALAQFGRGFGTVIIDQRNQVAVNELEAIIEREPEVDSVAILYGAAHMEDMGERLADQLGYRPQRDTWLTAFEVDLAGSAMTPGDLDQIRRMVRRQLRMMTGR